MSKWKKADTVWGGDTLEGKKLIGKKVLNIPLGYYSVSQGEAGSSLDIKVDVPRGVNGKFENVVSKTVYISVPTKDIKFHHNFSGNRKDKLTFLKIPIGKFLYEFYIQMD